MQNQIAFGEILDMVDGLPFEDQSELIDILHHRITEQRREQLAKDIRDAGREFERGLCKPAAPDDIMKAILS